MRDIVSIIRAIVREELSGHRAPDLGVVTQVFPGPGENNHEVNVRLRDTGLEIERAPVAVARPGLSILPRVGDLVMVAFAGGDLNAPVVIGFGSTIRKIARRKPARSMRSTSRRTIPTTACGASLCARPGAARSR